MGISLVKTINRWVCHLGFAALLGLFALPVVATAETNTGIIRDEEPACTESKQKFWSVILSTARHTIDGIKNFSDSLALDKQSQNSMPVPKALADKMKHYMTLRCEILDHAQTVASVIESSIGEGTAEAEEVARTIARLAASEVEVIQQKTDEACGVEEAISKILEERGKSENTSFEMKLHIMRFNMCALRLFNDCVKAFKDSSCEDISEKALRGLDESFFSKREEHIEALKQHKDAMGEYTETLAETLREKQNWLLENLKSANAELNEILKQMGKAKS